MYNIPHTPEGTLDLVGNQPLIPTVSITNEEDLGLSNHLTVITTLAISKPPPAWETFESRINAAINVDGFRLHLMASYYRSNVNEFAHQLRVSVVSILDVLATTWCMTNRCRTPSTRWRLSTEAVAARHSRRQIERRFRRTRSLADRLAT